MAGQLFKAAAIGNLDKVIALEAQWNVQNKKGETVLHHAVAEDQLEIVKYLVNHGVSLDYQDRKNGFTPVMLCLAQRPPQWLDILHALLKGKPDMNVQDTTGQTALHLATQYEAIEAVEMLIVAMKKVDVVDKKGMTPLLVAVAKGNLELVQLLVQRGHARLDVADAKGNNVLHWACISNGETSVELLEYLVSKGAQATKNRVGNTPLHSEATHCDPDGEWPSEAGSYLLSAFPDLEKQVNNAGQTAQQAFVLGEQIEEPEEPSPVAAKTQTRKRAVRKTKAEVEEEFEGNAAAARAAAIAHYKKKMAPVEEEEAKKNQEMSACTQLLIALLAFVVIAGLASLFSPSS